MSSKEDLKTKYSSYSNKKLIEILRYHRDYQARAVETARDLLNSRNISQEEIDQILDDLNEFDQREEKFSKEQLTNREKLIFFCVPILGFIFYLYMRFRQQELRYNKKVAESLIFSLLGALFVTVFLALIFRINAS